MIDRLLIRLAALALRHSWCLVVLWLGLVLGSVGGAMHLPQVLHAGPGTIEAGPSQRVARLLVDEFHFPYTYPLVVVIQSDRVDYNAWLAKLEAYLKQRGPKAVSIIGKRESVSAPLPLPSEMLLLGLAVRSFEEAERVVPRLRATLRTWLAENPDASPSLRLYVTGDAAFSYDMNALSAEQGLRAEHRVLPLALILLLVVFRSPVAAVLPLLIGTCGILLAMGCLYALAQLWELSVFARNITSMIGLGMGIDYALILVSRFRQEIRTHPLPEALTITMQTAGRTIAVSGLTVMASLAGLLVIPLIITRSIGLGGILVVGIILALALTLLPVLLVLLAPVLTWPLRATSASSPPRATWKLWSNWAMQRPWTILLVSAGCLLILSLPAWRIRLSPPRLSDMPGAMESRAGADRLVQRQGSPLSPVYVVLETQDGRPLAEVQGALSLPGWLASQEATYGRSVDFIAPTWLPLAGFPFTAGTPAPGWSEDGSRMLILAYPRHEAESDNLVRDLRRAVLPAGIRLSVGGIAALNVEFETILQERFPWVLGWVAGATGLILLVNFRSLLIPLKALLMNILTVAAVFGCLVLVFQEGYGSHWLGLATVPGSVLLTVPTLLFCTVFGLSMDYEVFLLSRIQEVYQRSRNNREAVAEGLAQTGGLISGAALIMVIVFGAFTQADIILVKETGFSLGVAVLIDATLVRVLLVPAVMQLAGRWNWWLPLRPL